MSFKTTIKPYYKVPKRLKKTPSLTIRQMAAKIPQKTRLKSRLVGIKRVWVGRVPAALKEYTCYRVHTQNTQNGNEYRLAIYSLTPKITLDSKVIIDSPNPLFVFRYEYALAKRGNAFIYRSNGDMPFQTNPRLVPGFDHHVYKALQYLVKNTLKDGLRGGREHASANVRAERAMRAQRAQRATRRLRSR